MKQTIGFFTGARSEYGIMKNLLQKIQDDKDFKYKLYVSGLHHLASFGNTIEEIREDGFHIDEEIKAFSEGKGPGPKEFSFIVEHLSERLCDNPPDTMFVIGDRIETYGAVLACHFAAVPVIHSGGGTLTKGAVDNIYRYNITNLSTYHFATSKQNYNRLLELPTTDSESVFFTGTFAIDAINRFKNNPKPIAKLLPRLEGEDYCLMTFHPVTHNDENIHEVMDEAIKEIIKKENKILVTYPNNDPGYKEILSVIDSWRDNKSVIVREHLGAVGYYAALHDCRFVIGNSSSGIIEAPYFNKPVINIGSRQEGREADEGVTNTECDIKEVRKVLQKGFTEGWQEVGCNQIYGTGNTLEKILEILNERIISTDETL